MALLVLAAFSAYSDARAQTATKATSPQESAEAPAPKTEMAASPNAATSAEADVRPGLVTLILTETQSMDMEIIQWPDGGVSVPIKAMAELFGIEVQQSNEEKRFFYVDPVNHQQVDIDWGQRRIFVNHQEQPPGAHPLVRSDKGLLVKDDVYVDQAAFEALFQTKLSYDGDATTLSLSTERKLRLAQADGGTETINGTDSNTRIIRNPTIDHRLVEKIYVHHDSNYNSQASTQAGQPSTTFTTLMHNATVGIGGSLPGIRYTIKPSFIRFNGNTNFRQIDWSFIHEGKRNIWSLGSTDAGLSMLTSPMLNIWGLRLASRNAVTPTLTPQSTYEFSGRAGDGNSVMARINGRTVQNTVAKDNAYELEAVYLQPRTVNHIEIVEKDAQNRETRLMEKTAGYFPNMLPSGETAYSAFFGRTPVQFHPVLPDQKTPVLMPQSEKWLAGGRLFYGLTNRVTVGVSGAADRLFGKPKTYYLGINPLSPDLTGFNSYQRDSNFFNGQNLSATLRYQMTDRWQASADAGIGSLGVKPESTLASLNGNSGKAARLHLERQGNQLTWFADLFHYDPYYYTPSTTLYDGGLYDKEGVGTGVMGMLQAFRPIHYGVNWEHYKTNLGQLIPGGFINANRWSGNLNIQLSRRNSLSGSFGWLNGENREREFQQQSLDMTWRTQSLPWGVQGEVRAGHYFTNTLFLPSKTLQTQLTESPYENNILDAVLDIPVGHTGLNRIRISNRFSTFVHYGTLQGTFQFGRYFFEPLIQLSYGDRPQDQNRLGLKLGYQMASGARVSLSYYKLLSTFRSAAAPPSHIDTDQFYFDFTDVLGLMAKRLYSMGPAGDTAASITGSLFVDYRADGKPDKSEPGVQNVKILVDHQSLITTDARGRYRLTGLPTGYHTLEILPESLPLTLNAENPIYRLKIGEGKMYRLNIALLPEGGMLSGQLTLVDAAGKPITPKNLTLVLTDAAGTLLKYTGVDETGAYRFGNVPCGRYRVDLEPRMKSSGRYQMLQAPHEIELSPPRNYEEHTEIRDLNIKLLAL